ncbi:TPX2 domain-containing protein [Artemisia annua]|uniref:TPX2 domain-containing protein n=1 Tax=Artemisia annua TaxID=35608 RepID=A0A2U1NA72_ARTAN|nr:TPX2 domain-containing protein [Artemisia annua]
MARAGGDEPGFFSGLLDPLLKRKLAHYKKIVAQKAAAAALLEQEKAEAAARQLIDDAIENNVQDHISVSINSGTSQSRRPLLKPKLKMDEEVTKPVIKKKHAVSPLVSSIGKKPCRIPPTPAKYVASVNPRKDHITTPRTKNLTTKEESRYVVTFISLRKSKHCFYLLVTGIYLTYRSSKRNLTKRKRGKYNRKPN